MLPPVTGRLELQPTTYITSEARRLRGWVQSPIFVAHPPGNRAVARVGNDETPWDYRDANWAEVIVGVDPDPANNERIVPWTKDYWDALHPYSAGGAYVNFMMDEGQERVQATYGDNYDRLVAIKNQYDPTNLFRVNQNIRPKGEG